MFIKYIKSVIKLPKSVKYFFFTELLLGFGLGIWNLNLNLFLASKGLNSSQIGQIIAIGPLASAVFSLIAGLCCDKFGYKSNIFFGCIIKTAAMFFTAFSCSINTLMAARILNGLGDSLVYTSAYPYITSMVSDKEKNKVYSLMFSCTMFSTFTGNITAGFILQYLGLKDNFTSSLVFSAFIVGLVATLRYFLPATKRIVAFKRLKFYFPRQRFIILYMIFGFLGYIEYFLAYSMLNLICIKSIGFNSLQTALVVGLSVVMSSISSFFVPLLVNSYGSKKICLTVFTTLSFSYIGMAISKSYLFGPLAIISTLLSCMIVPLIDGPILNNIPENEKGGFSGLKLLVNNVGTSIGCSFAGFLLFVTKGYKLLYLFALLLVLSQIVIYVKGIMKEIEDN